MESLSTFTATMGETSSPSPRKRHRLRIDTERVQSELSLLGVKVRFALPYRARSKPVERTNLSVKEGFSKLFESYTGGSTEERPERLKILLKDVGQLPTVAQVDALMEQWLEGYYNCRPHEGRGMNGTSPTELYAEEIQHVPVRTVRKDELMLLMMRHSKPVKVTREGVCLHGLRFWSIDLMKHQGKRVYLRWDPTEAGLSYIFSLEDEFLCLATAQEALSHHATQEEIRLAEMKRKEAKRTFRRARETREEIAAEPNPILRVRKKIDQLSQGKSAPTPSRRKVISPIRTRLASQVEVIKEAEERRAREREVTTAPKILAAVAAMARPQGKTGRENGEEFGRQLGYYGDE